MGNLQALLYAAINIFFKVLDYVILARVLLSWLPISRSNPISSILYTLTEPILGPIRALLDKSPLGGGMAVDISPIIALFCMQFLHMILISVIGLL